MSKKKEIKHELKTFLDNLKDKTSMTFRINIYEGIERCTARIWEPEHFKNPDINRRCTFACNGDSDLCKKSFGKNNLPNSIKSLDALCNSTSLSDKLSFSIIFYKFLTKPYQVHIFVIHTKTRTINSNVLIHRDIHDSI